MASSDYLKEALYIGSPDYDPFKHHDGTPKPRSEILQELDIMVQQKKILRSLGKAAVKAATEPYENCDDPIIAARAAETYKKLIPWWRFW